MIMYFNGRFGQILLFSALAILFSMQTATAREYISHQLNGDNLIIQTDEGQVTLDYLTDYSVEVSFQSELDKKAQITSSFSLVEQGTDVKVRIEQASNQLKFSSDKLTAVIQKSPLKIQYWQQGQLLFEEAGGFSSGSKHEARGVRFKLSPDEKILGGGERVLGMDRRGHRLPLYNRAHYGYGTESSQMNYGLPAVFSSKQYMLLFDNPASGWLDIGKTKTDILAFEAELGSLSYVVVIGEDYADLTTQFTQITGRQPLPPRWALGYIASRFGYRDEQQARDTLKLFAEKQFPVDAIIFDLYWFGKDVKGHMGNLAWDEAAFPNPEKMMADFKADGINTVLITEPFVLTTSQKWQQANAQDVLAKTESGEVKTFDFFFGHTGIIDIFKPQAKSWFWQIYQDLMQQGVAGWWGDLGEPEVHPADALHLVNGKLVSADAIHNVYGHEWAKTLFQNQTQAFLDKRPFILMRSGFAGSQRYGILPWTGDVSRSWDGLKPQVELSLQMSLFGLAYTHSDLGGFAGDNWDEELYIRWLQYGVFQPIYRPHAQDAVAPEPVFHSEQVQNIIRQSVNLRYQLMPYLYTMAFENSQTGKALMQPVFYKTGMKQDMDDRYDYLWGDAFFVSPIMNEGVQQKQVNLPAGIWFDFFSDHKFEGGQPHQIAVNLENIPVFVKAGAFVPMLNEVNNAANYDSKQLRLHYYHDESIKTASSYIYEDDGQTPNAFEKGAYEKLYLNAKTSQQHIAFQFEREIGHSAYSGMPAERLVDLVIHQAVAPNRIEVNGQKLNLSLTYAAYQKSAAGGWYNPQTGQLWVKFSWPEDSVSVLIEQ